MDNGIYVGNRFALTLVGVITVLITLLFIPVLMSWMSNATTADLMADLQQRGYTAFADADGDFDVPGDLEVTGDITAGGSYYGDGSNLTGITTGTNQKHWDALIVAADAGGDWPTETDTDNNIWKVSGDCKDEFDAAAASVTGIIRLSSGSFSYGGVAFDYTTLNNGVYFDGMGPEATQIHFTWDTLASGIFSATDNATCGISNLKITASPTASDASYGTAVYSWFQTTGTLTIKNVIANTNNNLWTNAKFNPYHHGYGGNVYIYDCYLRGNISINLCYADPGDSFGYIFVYDSTLIGTNEGMLGANWNPNKNGTIYLRDCSISYDDIFTSGSSDPLISIRADSLEAWDSSFYTNSSRDLFAPVSSWSATGLHYPVYLHSCSIAQETYGYYNICDEDQGFPMVVLDDCRVRNIIINEKNDIVVTHNYQLYQNTSVDELPGAKQDGLTVLDASTSSTLNCYLLNAYIYGSNKQFVMLDASNSATVTVTTHADGAMTEGTFDEIGDIWWLFWDGTQWIDIKKTAT